MLRIVLSGGGTLGSVSPLLAIRERMPEADYLFVGTKRGPERSFLKNKNIRFKYIGTAKLRRYISIGNLIDVIKFPFILFQSVYIIYNYKPDVILTSGGFVSVPLGIAGKLLNIPVFMHQQDLRIGLANKILQRCASVITVTFESQKKHFPPEKTIVTGNPIRNLDKKTYSEKKMLLILGGSLGAQGMNNTINSILRALPTDMEIVHVLGMKNFYQRLTIGAHYTPLQFLLGDYEKYVQEAQVVISRGGMSTLTELANFKKAVIVIPMPGSHQEENAVFFQKRNAVIVVPQSEPELLKEKINLLLSSVPTRAELGSALHDMFPVNAADTYVKIIREKIQPRKKIKPVAYFIGIGGIGISALVRYFREEGYQVLGSDLANSEVTRRLEQEGIPICYGHDKNNIPPKTTIVLYSSAIPKNNVELLEAQRRNCALYSYNEYLSILTKKRKSIAIAGTHGKTTTTALTGLVLKDAGIDPSIIVGSLIPQLNYRNYYRGTGEYLVVEACEYRSHMLLLHPLIAVITNIEEDHLDYFRDINDIRNNFQRFARSLPANGLLIKNADDPNLRDITASHTVTVGLTDAADIHAQKIRTEGGKQFFRVMRGTDDLGEFTLQIPGTFNIMNALSTIAVALHLAIDIGTIRTSLARYQGSWRRFEKVGTYASVPVYSDYAHHPTEIKATLKAFKEFFPDKKIFLVFQPHSFDRTEKLFDEFRTCFTQADSMILTEIYDVAGRDTKRGISSKTLFDALKRKNTMYAATLDEAENLIAKNIQPHDILVFMGAGNIDDRARTMVKKS